MITSGPLIKLVGTLLTNAMKNGAHMGSNIVPEDQVKWHTEFGQAAALHLNDLPPEERTQHLKEFARDIAQILVKSSHKTTYDNYNRELAESIQNLADWQAACEPESSHPATPDDDGVTRVTMGISNRNFNESDDVDLVTKANPGLPEMFSCLKLPVIKELSSIFHEACK